MCPTSTIEAVPMYVPTGQPMEILLRVGPPPESVIKVWYRANRSQALKLMSKQHTIPTKMNHPRRS